MAKSSAEKTASGCSRAQEKDCPEHTFQGEYLAEPSVLRRKIKADQPHSPVDQFPVGALAVPDEKSDLMTSAGHFIGNQNTNPFCTTTDQGGNMKDEPTRFRH